MSKKYKFKLPIGDWSGDGHSQCDYYIIESNVSVEKLREIYFDTKIRTNSSLDGSDWDKMREYAPCEEHEDSYLSKKKYLLLGLPEDKYEEFVEDDDGFTYSELFANLFVFYMTYHNPTLNLMITHDDIQMLPFYGLDDKKRYIGYMGYGLFQ